MKFLVLTLVLVSQMTFAGNPRFDKALSQYEKLHQAFFDNDLTNVKKEAAGLLASVNKIEDTEISAKLTYTKKKLGEIIEAKSLEESKTAFNTVSQGLLVVLDKQAPNKSYARYYCPMVKKYWIQNISQSEKVMNPYASSSMPHCGAKK